MNFYDIPTIDISQICAQAIFSALDHLRHWTFRQIRKTVLAAKNRKDRDDCKNCVWFMVKLIPVRS